MSFFDNVLKVLRQAETKVIAGRRCWIVDESEFHRLLEFFEGYSPGTDMRVTQQGHENFLIRLSSQDSQEYAVCTKAKPILDTLWKEMNPEPEVESEAKT